MRKLSLQIFVIFAITCSASVSAQEKLQMEGTEITGNKELPRVLYIVPWKSADRFELTSPPVASVLDQKLGPIDQSERSGIHRDRYTRRKDFCFHRRVYLGDRSKRLDQSYYRSQQSKQGRNIGKHCEIVGAFFQAWNRFHDAFIHCRFEVVPASGRLKVFHALQQNPAHGCIRIPGDFAGTGYFTFCYQRHQLGNHAAVFCFRISEV